MQQQLSVISRIIAVASTFLVGACASYNPGTTDQLEVRERLQTIEENGLRVSTAVLSRDEASKLFDADLHKRNIQAVWLEIENNTDKPFWLMMHSLDPNYFSANEVAYMNHKSFSSKANREMDAYFASMGFNQGIKVGQKNSGFAFSNEKIGTKEVRIRLYSNKDVRDFEFFVSIPGIVSDWDKTDLGSLYTKDELVLTTTEEELLAALSTLPCCLQRESGEGQGQPINIAFIGKEEVLAGLLKAGWDETVFLRNFDSLLGAKFLFERPPDILFEKKRRRIDATNSLRLWVTPIRFNGKAVSVGSIKRSIDPNIDAASLYLLEDMAAAGSVKRFGIVDAMKPVDQANPKKTLGGDPYWTTGQRLVLEVPTRYTPMDEIASFGWSWEGKILFAPVDSNTSDPEHD
jgi:hypothetical protein